MSLVIEAMNDRRAIHCSCHFSSYYYRPVVCLCCTLLPNRVWTSPWGKLLQSKKHACAVWRI